MNKKTFGTKTITTKRDTVGGFAKKTGMGDGGKRWSVLRKSTGNVIARFATRAAARAKKQTLLGKATMFDNVRMVAVR
jgi:hypothetical protein